MPVRDIHLKDRDAVDKGFEVLAVALRARLAACEHLLKAVRGGGALPHPAHLLSEP